MVKTKPLGLHIKCSREEKETIQNNAKKSNMTLSEYMRACAMIGIAIKKEIVISYEEA